MWLGPGWAREAGPHLETPLVEFCLPCLLLAFLTLLLFVFLSKGIVDPPEGTKIYKDSWDFDPYLETLYSAVEDEIFLHPSWIKEYFTWAGFKNYNLVVRVCSLVFQRSL